MTVQNIVKLQSKSCRYVGRLKMRQGEKFSSRWNRPEGLLLRSRIRQRRRLVMSSKTTCIEDT
jgi:hypothetical protein